MPNITVQCPQCKYVGLYELEVFDVLRWYSRMCDKDRKDFLVHVRSLELAEQKDLTRGPPKPKNQAGPAPTGAAPFAAPGPGGEDSIG